MEQIKDRILRIIAHYCNGNKAEFSRMMGTKPQVVNSWCTRENLGFGVINTICDKLPDINKEWLISGNGEMFREESGLKEREPEMKPIPTNTSELNSNALINIIIEQQRQAVRYQEQIDRLINLLERKNV